MPSVSRPRLAGLDGLRAVAVLLVVVYHLFPVLPGGFLGVDVFFVISGFLITTLLLREHDDTGRIALGRFWIRRVRRLLPALTLVVAATATAAWFVGGDILVGFGRQLLGALTFAYNWVALWDGASYFTADQPELLRNLWSLAVEEQFYLLWPLLLVLILRWRSRAGRTLLATGLAAGSVAWAVALAGEGATRTYYGTDTHAYGLLIGVALAFALHGRLDQAPARRRLLTGVLGLAAVGGMVALALLPPSGDLLTFPGVLVATSVLSAVAIAAAVQPGGWLGRALDTAPLRWIGERSYGIYLWHWPLVVVATVAATGLSPDTAVPVPVGAGVLVLSIALAALSYRYVEQPVRRLGLRGVWRAMERRLRSTPLRRFSTVTGILVGLALVGGTTAAVADAPRMATGEAVVHAGAAALDAASDLETSARMPGAALRPGSVPLPPQCATTHLAEEGGMCVAPDGRPAPPAVMPVPGSRITAIGDSVMLASAGGLLERFPGIEIDAKVSRGMASAPAMLAELDAAGRLRDYVVVALGTNGPVSADTLAEIRRAIGPERGLILVNATAPRDWIPGVNETLAAFAATNANVAIADWEAAIAPHIDLLAGDRIHPGAAGGRVFADAVSDAVQDLETRQAQVRYQVELAQWALARLSR